MNQLLSAALKTVPEAAAWQWVPGTSGGTLLVAGRQRDTRRAAPDPIPVDEVIAVGDASVAGRDLTALPRLTRLLDEVALLAMARTLDRARLFRQGREHDAAHAVEALGTAPRHAWIVRRWLTTLATEKRLGHDARTGRYRDLVAPDRAEYARARRTLEEACRGLGYPPSMTRFFLAAADRLPALLRDETGLQGVLFPGGETDTAEGNYRDNVPSRWANHAAAALVAREARARRGAGPLRILEVGAGVGGTTAPVLDALTGTETDYLFTDVSRFFLSSSRAAFAGRPGLRFAVLDINVAPADQGMTAGSRDVILAANVLHNARHIGSALAGLRELLEPDGLLVLVESCREHYQALTSMYLLMSPAADEERWFTDPRAGQDRVFLTAEEWTDQLDAAGFDPLPALPGDGHPLATAGQRVLAGRVRTGAHRPDPARVSAVLATRLPAADRPVRVHAVDRPVPSPATATEIGAFR
ncbi:class I SAM-dependent methyltransferase [Streptomyces botrytidirepellens]|uniref:Class I SAM-dependent methyltransferase n=1 Tax=Streptomyces botrytidirepellens TaxID=2486417 RepID=A0A3M8X4D2_9ACTN|nr:class I SAM-dependent methyltransferase [Streptomyces botrytidirepellens]RNG36060.1 class I SAM-dependent methyltransferase [Streptomyces botrytidirepellens]